MFRTLTIAAILMVSVFATLADTTATNSPDFLITMHPSKFVSDPKKGKDPFFPDSIRRLPAVPRTGSLPIESSEPVRKEPISLSLKGIVVKNPGQKLALINNQIFAVGESKYLRGPSGTARVTCLQIDERKVLVEVEGITGTRELKLKEGL
jgi:hypothetical protein